MLKIHSFSFIVGSSFSFNVEREKRQQLEQREREMNERCSPMKDHPLKESSFIIPFSTFISFIFTLSIIILPSSNKHNRKKSIEIHSSSSSPSPFFSTSPQNSQFFKTKSPLTPNNDEYPFESID
jgi:hypothetical protein